jgi:hypothetical protein
MQWITQEDGKLTALTQEPGASFWRELVVGAVAMLPIDGQL